MFRFLAENKAKGINLRKPTRQNNKTLCTQTEKLIQYKNVSIFCKKKNGGKTG